MKRIAELLKFGKKNDILRESYFRELGYYLMKGKLKFLLHYHWLVLKKMMGYKIFKISHTCVATADDIVTIGKEYQYREGGMLERITVDNIRFDKFFLNVRVYFIDLDRYCNVSHTFRPYGYSGMWRIWDKNHYDLEEWRQEHSEPVDQALFDSLPVIEIS